MHTHRHLQYTPEDRKQEKQCKKDGELQKEREIRKDRRMGRARVSVVYGLGTFTVI